MSEWSATDESLLHGLLLSRRLSTGQGIPTIQPRFILPQDEDQFATIDQCTLLRFLEGDSTYVHRQGAPLANLFLWGPTNEAKRQKALKRSAAKWRPVLGGRLHVTSARFVLESGSGFESWWYSFVKRAERRPEGLLLGLDWGWDMFNAGVSTDWLFVALHYIAWQSLIEPPVDSSFLKRARDEGRLT